MSVCYHRGVREQWYLYRKYLKLTPRAFLCASKEKGHAVSDEALLSVNRTVLLSSLKKKLRRSRSLVGIWGHPQSREVANHPGRAGSGIVGGRVLKKWPCGRECHLIRMYWSLAHPFGCVLRRAVPCPSAGLKDRSLSGAILIILLNFRSLWCDESDPQVSLLATLPRVKGCRHESRI